MFYPVDYLKRGGRFYLCWVADSWPLCFATITQKQLWSQDIRKICDDIIKVVTNESGRPTKRFSLRLSSQLMRGLVRLYQRKTTVLLSELCVINAHIMKNVNKKWHRDETSQLERREHPPLQQLTTIPQILSQDEHETTQIVEDLIRNSGNVVSNVQDITLKEATIPELVLPVKDGFGEENPEQTLQLLGDRTLEVMLQGDSVVLQRSGLEVPLDVTGKSQDKSRPAHELLMERISEHDITMFGKEIPEIPDITLPDLPVPQITKLVTDNQVIEPPPQAVLVQPTTSVELHPNEEIELEDLDETEIQPKRRRLKNKLKIDKRTIIPGDVFRSRINDTEVELRCKNVLDDTIDTRLPWDVYFRRPCHAGRKVYSDINLSLTRLFQRNLGPVSKQPLADKIVERAMARSQEPVERTLIENIEEVCEPALQVGLELSKIPPERISEIDISKEIFLYGTEVRKSVAEEIDISNLLTQKVSTLSQQSLKRAGDEIVMDKETIKRKRSDFTTFSRSQQDTLKDAEKSIQAMLQDAGLADIPTCVEQTVHATEKSRRDDSGGSETPLGSLDRTKVSLGDSVQTTDSQKFMREQWGTEGTMIKIIKFIKSGVSPVTVETLLTKGPVIPGYTKFIAAKCFTSILKLKHHGFINIIKMDDTLEIADMTLTSKFDQY